MSFPPESRLRTAGIAIAFAVGLLVATHQLAPHGLYGLHGMYRAQVDAMLDGRLALTVTPDGLAHDLAWTQHGVQQVWGLGVPAWQAPFELLGRAIGVSPFPDRVALIAWLALVAYVVLRAVRTESKITAIGSVVIVLLLPGVVALARTKMNVYEEAALYSYGASALLLAGTIGFARKPTAVRLVVILAFAGATGFLRPTVWFYGAATAAVVTGIWLRARGRRGIPALALAAALFAAGGVGLYATNARRFGDGMEFGHRLNLEGLLAGNVYATRFSYPYQRVGMVAAAEELVGALFDRPEKAKTRGFFGRGLAAGEADVVRWREYYFTTYTWAYVPILLAGFVLGALAWRRRPREGDTHLLWAWAVIGTGPLAVFYLHSPSLSSRYLLDLAPGFVALILIAWRAFATRLRARPWIALAVLLALWLAAILTAQVHFPKIGSRPVDQEAAIAAQLLISRPVPLDRTIPDGFDFDGDLYANTASASDTTFERCATDDGRLLPCADAIAGDTIVRGRRTFEGKWWDTVTSTLDDDDPQTCSEETTCDLDLYAVATETGSYGPGLYLNAANMDSETGRVPPATFFYVEDAGPRVELDVSGGDPAKVYAAIDRVHLSVIGGADLPGGVTRIIFAVPQPMPGLRVLFLAFGADTEFDRRWSEFTIHRVHWRN